ncbi:aminoacyl-tRNA hydrolase [Candidatus Omnitrophota bacterium]
MKLIVGLGNPGKRYINTRHNIGFRVAEELLARYQARTRKRFFSNARESRVKIFENDATVIMPLTFMNLSGGCVSVFLRKLKISHDDLLIICDDINLDLGDIRLRPKGSFGGHNGLESIIKSLGTDTFPRLKVGIRSEKKYNDLADYVLSDFKKHEQPKVADMTNKAVDVCESWVRDGINKAMNVYNA